MSPRVFGCWWPHKPQTRGKGNSDAGIEAGFTISPTCGGGNWTGGKKPSRNLISPRRAEGGSTAQAVCERPFPAVREHPEPCPGCPFWPPRQTPGIAPPEKGWPCHIHDCRLGPCRRNRLIFHFIRFQIGTEGERLPPRSLSAKKQCKCREFGCGSSNHGRAIFFHVALAGTQKARPRKGRWQNRSDPPRQFTRR